MASAIHQHESAIGVHVPSLLNPPPPAFPTPSLQAVTEHLLWFLVSHIRLAVAVCFTYGNVYVSVLSSQIIPHTPPPTERNKESQWFRYVRFFGTPWTEACQAHLSMEFSRQKYWSREPFPSPGDLPNLGIEPGSPALRQILYPLSHQGSC